MKKLSIFVAFLLFGLVGMQAAPVDAAKARKVADSYVRINGLYDKTQKVNRVTDITSQTTFTAFYVFRIEGTPSGKGFVLVSADDCARPILGYSAENDFAVEGMPAHVESWLREYEQQIGRGREAGLGTNPQWQRLLDGDREMATHVVVGALVATRWNQSPLYNNLCPYDSTANERSVTGCVATAMAQLMKYWNRPVQGTGSHSYTHNDYGTQSANFGATTYDWAHMPVQLTSSSTATEINAVATLMYHCGVAVEMDYSPSGSGATTIGRVASWYTAEMALINYFDYNSSLQGRYMSDYSDLQWKQMLMNELNAGRPMIYRGSSDGGGHSFICDGYDSDTNFHFNLGWGGSSNGFYSLSAVDPNALEYNGGQGAIMGIYPNNMPLMTPGGVQVTGVNTTTATVSWVNPNNAGTTQVQVAYGPTATFNIGNSATYTVTNATGNSKTLSGLTAYTQYSVAMRCTSGTNASAWTEPVTFTTLANPQPAPALIDCESGLPTYWTQEQVNGNIFWTQATGGYNGRPSGALSGSHNLRLQTNGHGAVTRLISPMLLLGQGQNSNNEYSANVTHKMAFGHAQANWSGDVDYLYVYYRTSPTADWNLLASYTEEIANWQRDTVTLPNTTNTYQVAFEGRLNYGYGVVLDDISFFSEQEVNDSVVVTDDTIVCDSYTVTDNNGTRTITTTGTYRLVYTAASGIDSIIMRTVMIRHATHNSTTASAVGRYIWHDSIYTESGTHVYTYTNAYGCPSADTLHLTIEPCVTLYRNQYVDACDEYLWSNGVTYYESTNDAYDTLTVDGGCDLILTLNLTIYHSTHNNYTQTAMNTYTWHDSLYFETGDFPYHYTDVHGCASADTLHLTITPAPAVVVDDAHPFYDDFEGDFSWYLENGATRSRWAYGSAAAYGGTHAMYISDDRGHSNHYVISQRSVVYASKLFTLTAGMHFIGYDWRANGESNYDYIRVFLAPASATFTPNALPNGSTGNTNTYTTGVPAGWIALDGSEKKNLDTTWQSFTAEANVTAAGNYRVVFVWISDNSVGQMPPAAIDNVTIQRTNCGRPTDVVVSNVTPTGATVTWRGTGTQYLVAYGTGSDPAQMATVTTSDTTITLTGLTDNTDYNVYVRNVCSPTLNSAWSGMVSFITPCLPLVVDETHPYNENFEGARTWWMANGNRTNRWHWGTAVNNGGSRSIYISNDNGLSNTYTNTQRGVTYATKLFALKGGAYHIGYDWRAYGERNNAGTNYDYLRVFLAPAGTAINPGTSLPNGGSTSASTSSFVSTTPAGWISADSSYCKNYVDTWQHFETDVAIPDSGDYVMMFVWLTDENTGTNPPAAVDNISITRPTCSEPFNLAVTTVTATSATLVWTGNGNNYQMAYGTGSNVNQMTRVNVTGNTYTLTGLAPNTQYNVFVRGVCDDNSTTAWTGPAEINTPCAVYTITQGHALTENFENGMPGCWRAIYPCSNNAMTVVASNATSNSSYNNSHSLRFSSYYNCGEGFDQYFISQEISCAAPLQMTFHYRDYNQNNNLWVGYSTTGNSPEHFTQWEAVPNSTEWTTYSCEFPLGTKYVAIRYYGNYSYYSYIDDIELRWAQYHITALTSDSTQGTTAGSSTRYYGATATLRAFPTACYQFSQWNDGNTDNPRPVTVTQDSTFTAYFTPATLTGSETVAACESYRWGGTTYRNSGTYSRHITTAAGCDSVATLHLTINHGITTTVAEAACDSYTWHDSTFTTSGTHVWHGQTTAGCDSTVTLTLTVNHGTHNVVYDTSDMPYPWHGSTYAESGTYTYNYMDTNGCASTDTLHLTIVGCRAITTLPYTEGFEESATGTAANPVFDVDCWQRHNNATTYIGYPFVATGSMAHGGSNMLNWSNNTGSSYGSNIVLVMPQVNTASHAINTLRLRFWARTSNNQTTGELQVGVMTDPDDTSTFQQMGTLSHSGATWTEQIFDFFGYTGTGSYIALRTQYPTSNWTLYLDDFTIEEQPACPIPNNIAASDVTANSATLTWQGTGNSYTVYYGTGTNTTTMDSRTVYDDSVTLTGLSSYTVYNVYIVSHCTGGSSSGLSQMYTFQTECNMVSTLPFTEGFEGYTSGSFTLPCWKHYSVNNYPSVTATYHTGNRGLYWYRAANTERQYIVMPGFIFDVNTLEVRFWGRTSSSSYHPAFEVGVMDSPTDTASFVSVGTINVEGSTWVEYIQPLSYYTGTGHYIALRSAFNTIAAAYLDDITVDVAPTCATPIDVTVSNITTHTATVSWTGLIDNYVVAYGTGTDPSAMDSMTVNGSTVTLTGLAGNTTYNLFVRSVCSGGRSTWSPMVSFTTECELLEMPYVEGFESYNTTGSSNNNFSVDCWHRFSNGTTYYSPYVGNSTVCRHAGNRGLYWNMANNTSYGTSQYVVLPGLDTSFYPMSRHQLSFWARANTSTQRPVFIVGVMSDPYDTMTFVPVDTLNITSTAWTEYTFTFENYTGNGRNIAICARANGGWVAGMDDLKVSIVPICFPPTSVASNNVSSTGATITWNGGNGIGFRVAYGTGTDPATMDSIVVMSGNNTTLTGLLPMTTYNVYIQPICATERGEWSTVYSFTTGCGLIATLPYTWGFEGCPTGTNETPNADFGLPCWTHLNNGSRWTGSPYITGNLTHAGTRALYWETNPYVTNSQWPRTTAVVLPALDPSVDVSGLRLKFWANRVSDASRAVPTFRIGVMTNPNNINTFTQVATIIAETNGWAEYYADFYAYTGTGHYIAIRADGPTQNNYYLTWTAYMDDVTLELSPSCIAPTGVTVSGITPTTATVAWSDPVPGQTVHQVAYGTGTTPDGMTTVNVTTGSSRQLTGLAPNTTYNVFVRALCGGNDNSEWTPMATFVTPCTLISSLPYTENFDSYTSFPIDCWNRLNNGTWSSFPTLDANNTHSGNRCINWNALNSVDGGTYQAVVMPAVDVDIYPMNTLRLRVWARKGSGNGTLQVGIMTDPGNINTFTQVGTISPSDIDNYIEYIIPFSSYTGSGQYVALRAVSPGSTDYWNYAWQAWTDDFTLEVIPSCLEPTGLAASVITDTSATLTWSGSATTYEVAYGTTTTLADMTSITATGHSVQITGLANNTLYYAYIRAICSASDTSAWTSTPVSFRTQCPATIHVPYSESFETYTTGSTAITVPCWNFTMIGSASYQDPSNYPLIQRTLAHTGNYSLALTGDAITQLPATDTALNLLQIKLWVRKGNSDADNKLEVGVMHGTTFIPIDTLDVVPNTYVENTIYLAGYNGNSRVIAFRNTCRDNYTYSPFLIDDIELTFLPACLAVQNVHVTNITPSTLTIDWSDMRPATSWEIEYGPTGFTLGHGTTTIVSSHPATLTGLFPGTEYSFRVRTLCGDNGNSEWSDVSTAITDCGLTNVPYMQDFDNVLATSYNLAGFLPSCWEGYTNGTSNTYLPHVVVGGSNYQYAAANNGLCLISGNGNYGTVKVVRLPQFAQPINTLAVKFWSRKENANYGTLTVGYLTGDNMATDYVQVATIASSTTGTYDSVEFTNVPATAQYIAFRWECTGTWYSCGLDNVEVYIPSATPCDTPTGLQATAVSSSGATLTWNGNATGYIVAYGLGNTPENMQTVTVNDTTVTLTGLTGNTTYNVYVRSDCGDGNLSLWSTMATFHTDCALITSLPYTEGFEGSTPSYFDVACWNRIYTNNYPYPMVNGSANFIHTGSRSIQWMNFNNTTQYVVLPGLDNTVIATNGTKLTFWAKSSSDNVSPSITVGVMTDANDTTTFTPVTAVTVAGTEWVQYTAYLSNYTGNGTYITLRGGSIGGGRTWIAYLDDFAIEEAPNCSTVLPVVTTTTACDSYTWHGTAYSASGSYTFDTLLLGICPRTDTLHLTISHGTHNSISETVDESYTWHGITYTATGVYTYEYTDADGCASTDTLHLTVDPYLPVLVNETHPFNDGFEGTTLRWQLFNGTLTNQWRRGTAAYSNGSQALYISNNDGTANAYSNSSTTVYASKKFILPAGHFYFSYDWRANGENGYDYMRVYLAPATATFTASTSLPTGINSTSTPSGWIALDRGSQMNLSTDWSNHAAEVNITDSAVYQVVFVWRNDNTVANQPPAAIDEVNFIKSDCYSPTNITAQNITATTATLSWTGTAGSYLVVYGTSTAIGDMDTLTANGNTITLTGLAHTTTHYAYVKSLCSANDLSPWSQMFTFRTACGAFALPYSYGIDDPSIAYYNTTLHECWTAGNTSGNTNNDPSVSTYYSHGGTLSIYMTSSNNYYSYLVLPAFDNPVDRTQLTFWGRATGANYPSTLEIGLVASPTDIASFELVDTFTIPRTGVLQWHQHEVLFDTYHGNGQHIAIRLPANGDGRCYLDDFVVEALPECSGARNLAVAGTTENSVTLTWHETGAATSWGIEYGPQGFAQGSGTTVTVTDTTATLTGLTNDTWYDIYIHSDCVHATSRAQRISAQTDCGRMAIPFYEDFSGYASSDSPIDRCWYKCYSQNNSQTSYPQFTYNSSDNSDYFLYFLSTRNYYSYLVLPSMQGNIHDQMLRFKVKTSGGTSANIQVGVVTTATNFNTFQQVQQLSVSSNSEWNTVNVPFNSLNGTNYRIAIVSPSLSSSGSQSQAFYVDDIEVVPIPDCNAPASLAAGSITTTSATLSWSAVQGISRYRVVYTPHGDYDSSYRVTVDSVAATSLPLTGLQMGTTYDVEVYSLCITGSLSTAATTTFSTSCSAHSVPFTENFDHGSGTHVSPCWNNGFYGSATSTYPTVSAANPNYEGDKALLFFSSSNNMYSYAILPELDDTLSLLQFKLQARANTVNSNPSLQIGTVAASANITTFQTVQNVQLNDSWQYYTVPLTSATDNSRRLAIRYQPNGQGQAGNIFVDDIIVERIPACDGPARVTADRIVYNGARLHWPAVAGVTSYSLEYGPSGFTLGQGTQVTGLTDTTYILSGLNASTTYSVYLTATCASGRESSLVSVSFATGCLEQLPYEYGFEGLTTSPTGTVTTVPCWVLNENTSVQSGQYTTGYAAEGISRMRFSVSQATAYAVMPKLDDSINHLYMTLQVNTGTTYFDEPLAPLYVGVVTDPYDFSTFLPVDTLLPTASNTWQSFRVDFSSLTDNDYYIAFYGTGSYYTSYVYLDDIQVIRIAPYNIDLTLADASRGTVAVNGVTTNHAQALAGSDVTLTATANHGYTFSHWAAGITANPYTFTMPDHDVVYNHIVFSLNTYTVTVLSNDTTLGTVTGGGSYDYLDTATLTATPIGNYNFLRWSDGVTTNPRTLIVTDDTTLTALFQNDCPVGTDTTIVACDSYTWNDTPYTATGVYTHDRSTAQCTVVDTLHLTINHSTHNVVYDTAELSYTWHDSVYTATGVYTYDYTNTDGCASSDTLHLVIDPTLPVLVDEEHPFFDDFEEGLHWTFTNGTSQYTNNPSINAWYYGTAAPHTGSHSIYISNDNGVSNNYSWTLDDESDDCPATYASKRFILRQGAYSFSYDWRSNGNSSNDYLRVYLVPDAEVLPGNGQIPTSWIALDGDTALSGQTVWNYHAAQINVTTPGIYKMVFLWKNSLRIFSEGHNPPAAVDNVSIVKTTCTPPTNLSSSNTTTTAATLAWTGTGTRFTVAYGIASSPLDMDTLSVTGNSVRITNLSPSSYYHVFVRKWCDASQASAWSEMFTFNTGCGPMTELPMTESFESCGVLSYPYYIPFNLNCWNILSNNSTAAPNILIRAADGYAHSGNNLMDFPIFSNSDYYIVLPQIDTHYHALNNLYLSFWAYPIGYLYTPAKLAVGVMDSPTDTGSFTPVDTLELFVNVVNNTLLPGEFGVNLRPYQGSGSCIALRPVYYNSDRSILLDDIIVDYMPANADTTVVACGSYTWGDTTYTTSGIYSKMRLFHAIPIYDTLRLTILPATTGSETLAACDSYTWHGTTYIASGTYTFDTLNANGCDSTATLHLTVNHSTANSESLAVCDNYTWHGTRYTASGDYTYNYTNAEGCASTDTLHLTVNHSTSRDTTAVACDSFTWRDSIYTSSTRATSITTNAVGCDSTVTLHLTVNRSTHDSFRQTACDSYTWHGTPYTTSGVYTNDYTNAAGCASTDTLHLTVNYSNTGIDTQTACDSYRWINGVTYTSSTNTPTFTLTNHHRCDSVVTLNLTINHHSSEVNVYTRCDSLSFLGNTYTLSGNYFFDTVNDEGCSHFIELRLTVRHSTHDNYYQNSCGSYTWYGTTYTTSGTYIYNYTNAERCASTDTLHLVIDQHTDTAFHVTACDGYRWNDSLYTQSGVYTYNYSTAGSTCTNVDTLYLTVNHSATVTITDTACDSYTWHDSTYTFPFPNIHGFIYPWPITATYVTTTVAGCDSVETLRLTLNRSVTGADIVTACDRYTWINGITYTTSNYNTSNYTLAAANGCDSVVTLYLTLNHSTAGDTTAIACDSFDWRGTNYTSTTSATSTTTNAAGCDSVVTLHLTVNYSTAGDTVATACDSFDWHDSIYTSSTSATSTTSNVAGCDSVVTLHLTVNYSTEGDTVATACERFTWRDSSYTSSTSATSITSNIAGCDSTVTLHLTIYDAAASDIYDTACESYIWADSPNSQIYTESGDYTLTGQTIHGCDSIVTLHLTVNHGTHDDYYQHACDTFVWHGTVYTATGTYLYEYQNADGCASVDTLHLTVDQHSDTAYHVTVCDAYRWNDSLYTESGIYVYDYSLAGSSCTNVDTLYLTVNHSADSDLYVTACDSYNWLGTVIPEGDWYTESGTYVRRLQTVGGCDSTATLHLTINHRSELDTTLVACDTLFWTVEDTTFTITESGDYFVVGALAWTVIDDSYLELGHAFLNAEGCDSTQTLHVTIGHSTTGDTVAVACDSFDWYGTSYTSSTSATRTTSNAAGCDSTVTLHLTVNYSTAGDTVATACDHFEWRDSSYTSTTSATSTTTNAAGCDSVVTLHLTINYGQYTSTYQAACDSFAWHDTVLTLSGSYLHYDLTAEGCLIIDTLVLTLSNGTSTGYHVETCDGYIWNGTLYTETGNYIYDYSQLGGDCQNVDTLFLTLHYSTYTDIYDTACDSYLWGYEVMTESGEYAFHMTTAYGCDSVTTIHLTIHYNTSTAYSDTLGADGTYTWHGHTYSDTGTYLYDYITDEGCASTDTLYLSSNYIAPVYYTLHARSADTVMGYVVVYPDSVARSGDTVIVVGVPHEGYRFTHWSDGDTNGARLVRLTSDTTLVAYFDVYVGIADVETPTFRIWAETGNIQVEGTGIAGMPVRAYDLTGRMLYNQRAEGNRVTISTSRWATGVYLVRVGNLPAQRIVLR